MCDFLQVFHNIKEYVVYNLPDLATGLIFLENCKVFVAYLYFISLLTVLRLPSDEKVIY